PPDLRSLPTRRSSDLDLGGFLDLGQVLLHRLLHLFEGAHLDLADAFPRDAEFRREVLEGDRVVREAACLEDPALARIEHREGVRSEEHTSELQSRETL